jgi:hypothetical protein
MMEDLDEQTVESGHFLAYAKNFISLDFGFAKRCSRRTDHKRWESNH